MSDLIEGTILIIAILTIVLMGLVLWLICLVMHLEVMVGRLRTPEVQRDQNGKPLKRRL